MKNDLLVCLAVAIATPTMAGNSPEVREISTNKNEVSPEMADTSRIHDLDEVVVVSQAKEFYTLRQQPVSSSVLTWREAERLGMRDLRDLTQLVPSFSMPNYGSRYTSSMYIRGIGSRVNSPAVGMYIDDLPLVNKSQFNFHSYEMERVDVLRGPQGTLYGMNTEGGMVRIYTRNPMEYQGTDVRLGFGTKAFRNVEASHYNKVSDGFAFSLAGFYEGQDGFFRNQTTGHRADAYDEGGGRLRLMFQPSAQLLIDYIADFQHVEQQGFPYGQLDQQTGRVAWPASNRQGQYRRDMLNTGLNLRWNAGAVSLYSTTSYAWLHDYMLMDIDYLPIDYMHMEQRQLQNALTEELTLKSNSQGRWKWTSGLYGSYQWLRTDAPVHFDDGMDQFLTNTIQTAMYNAMINSMAGRFLQQGMSEEQAREMAAATIERAGGVNMSVDLHTVPGLFHTPLANVGLFHESDFDITPRLKATLGLRYDYSHTAIRYATSASMTSIANVMGQEAVVNLTSSLMNSAHSHFNQLLPKVGLTWMLPDLKSNIYATVSKGYRTGGFNIQMFSDILQTELNANSSQRGDYDIPHDEAYYDNIRQAIAYKPEVSWNYEVGAHLNLLGNTVHLDLAAYYMQIRNQQLSVMASQYGFGRSMTNAGRSYSTGIEASLRGELMDNCLQWAVNYGFTHARFKDYVYYLDNTGDTDRMPINRDYDGNTVPYVPQHTLSLMADYRIPFRASLLHALTIGANMAMQGPTYWDEANTCRQSAYATLGAHADFDFGPFVLSLWGRNLTSTRYNTFAVPTTATGAQLFFAQRGNPFQCGVTAKLHL